MRPQAGHVSHAIRCAVIRSLDSRSQRLDPSSWRRAIIDLRRIVQFRSFVCLSHTPPFLFIIKVSLVSDLYIYNRNYISLHFSTFLL